MIYPVAGTEPNRGLEPGVQADQYQIIAGGFGIAVQVEVPPSSFSDQIRVLTCCDDTCTPILQRSRGTGTILRVASATEARAAPVTLRGTPAAAL